MEHQAERRPLFLAKAMVAARVAPRWMTGPSRPALAPMPSGTGLFYYVLAAVGIFTLLVGAAVRARRPTDQATLHFFWLSVAFFIQPVKSCRFFLFPRIASALSALSALLWGALFSTPLRGALFSTPLRGALFSTVKRH